MLQLTPDNGECDYFSTQAIWLQDDGERCARLSLGEMETRIVVVRGDSNCMASSAATSSPYRNMLWIWPIPNMCCWAWSKGALVIIDGQLTKINSGPGSPAMPGTPGTAASPTAPDDAKDADKAEPSEVSQMEAHQHNMATGSYTTIDPAKRG